MEGGNLTFWAPVEMNEDGGSWEEKNDELRKKKINALFFKKSLLSVEAEKRIYLKILLTHFS